LADKAGLFHQTESLSDSLLTLIMPAIQASMWLIQSSNVQPLAHARYSKSAARATVITLDNNAES
jgi:hypothetical protein